MTGAAVPILRSFSEAEAREVYLRYLGFEVSFEHRFADGMPLYMEVRRGDCGLHVCEHHGDAAPGAAVRLRVPDADAFLAELRERGHSRLNPGKEAMPWAERQVAVMDPFGNRLIFWSAAGSWRWPVLAARQFQAPGGVGPITMQIVPRPSGIAPGKRFENRLARRFQAPCAPSCARRPRTPICRP